jgi:hypothetical protein
MSCLSRRLRTVLVAAMTTAMLAGPASAAFGQEGDDWNWTVIEPQANEWHKGNNWHKADDNTWH